MYRRWLIFWKDNQNQDRLLTWQKIQTKLEVYLGVLYLMVCVSTKDTIKMLSSSMGMAESPSECVPLHCVWSCPFLYLKHWQDFICFCFLCWDNKAWAKWVEQTHLPCNPGPVDAAELCFKLCGSPPQLRTLRQFARAYDTIEQNERCSRGQVLSCQELSDVQCDI